jgi:hypothetical protein
MIEAFETVKNHPDKKVQTKAKNLAIEFHNTEENLKDIFE